MTDKLTPAIVQDDRSGQVLMLGHVNEDALRLTRETGVVHFFSRSRQELWRKGQTSGNTLNVVSIEEDCDGDALLIRAIPAGPTCHTGSVSCFGAAESFGALNRLWHTIQDRATTRPAGSYTASLLDAGTEAIGRKVVEEAVEVLLAATDESQNRISEEAADLMYHLLVLLAERDVEFGEVEAVLERRAGTCHLR